MQDFDSLEIWQLSRRLNKEIYLLSKKFPIDEKFGLISQIRRASVSVSSNIAEGCERRTGRDFLNFLSISMGSLREVQSQIFLSFDLEYVSKLEFDKILDLIDHLIRKMVMFMKYIERNRC